MDILKYRYTVVSIILLLAMLVSGCRDDFPYSGGGEGDPVHIRLGVVTTEAYVVSRSELSQGLDEKITSLWIAVYNINTGRRTGMTILRDPQELNPHELKSIELDALSGQSYIVGVANFEHRPAAVHRGAINDNLEHVLTDADTWDKFNNIAAFFDKEGALNIEAPLNPILMSGFYTESEHDSGDRPDEMTVVDIPSGTFTPGGAIHLRRLISHVRFNISYNTDNISNFKINYWEVINLPTNTWLSERPDTDADRNSADSHAMNENGHSNTPQMTNVTIDGAKQSFDFWMLENRRKGITPPAEYTNDNAYSWRESEYKNADGTNTGIFKSLVANPAVNDANNYATYVLIDVTMDMKVDENGTPLENNQRLVEAQYLVHLGYCEGSNARDKATDFNCRRNTKYAYNVTINNVGDLIVEAKKLGEPSPGAEGIITDISDSFYQLDAHYGQLNVYMTESNLKDFHYYILAYDLQGQKVIIDSQNRNTIPKAGSDKYQYLTWVEFRKTTDENTMAEYKPHTSGDTYYLTEMNRSRPEGWYTMFINEYTYEDETKDGNESGSTNWWGYVNRPDRRLWLNVDAHTGADGNTIHYKSKYAVSQRSIQTYYNLGTVKSGMGVEHDNESLGLNLRNNYRYSSDGNHESARYNLAEYLTSPSSVPSSFTWQDNSVSWSTFLDLASMQSINNVDNQNIVMDARTVALPKIRNSRNGNNKGNSYNLASYDPDRTDNPQYVELMRACLNRNRDLDGDGKIDAGELRWFVPTNTQYIRIILGRRSLVSPLVDLTGMTRLPNKSGEKNGYNSSMLYASSDGMMVWMMEGTSTSQWCQWGDCATPWQVRCVRNLGGNQSIINSTNVTEPAFHLLPNSNIIDLSRYEEKSLREEPYLSSALTMPIHHLYDQRYNRCYKSFEFHESILYLNDSRLQLVGKTITWSDYLNKTNPCAVLVSSTGKDGWRVPNQKEMAIIGTLGKANLNKTGNNVFSATCTFGYFDYWGYTPGSNPSNPSGTISSEFQFAMKARTDDGTMTQTDKMQNTTINGDYWGIRCVRDVE